jgi:hypothetical protein
MTTKELEDKYIRLNPHGIVNFCIVKVGNDLDDVIVLLHKMSDLATNEPTPYCACRQNITDVFAMQLNPDKLYVGCSMSLDTCPPDVDYRNMMACNGINKCINVCVYMDDTLDDLLSMINTKDFDRTLEALFNDHLNYVVKQNPTLAMMKDRMRKLETHDGYCKSLRRLLEDNNFMYDFYRSFNIIPINKKVLYDLEGKVDSETVKIIADINQINIVSTLCVKYWYDIDLEEIDNDYALVLDSDNDLFVIAYVSNGRKHIDIENVESEDNIEKLASFTDNKSVKEAMEYVRINKNKYN